METLVVKLKEWLCVDLLRLLSLLLAGYFLYVFHRIVGFPPEKDLTTTSITYLLLFILFLLLPLSKKIKLGKLFEFEAKVNEIKSEVKEFKEETRQLITMQNTLINTVSNTISQSVNITLPSQNEIQEAKEELNSTIRNPPAPDKLEEEIEELLASEGSDLNFALAKLRMEIERELRRILQKRVEVAEPNKMKGRFLSARSLFREFISLYPEYKGMYGSFDYVLKVCNAAVHGQIIPPGHAQEALQMGLKMLDELKNINNGL